MSRDCSNMEHIEQFDSIYRYPVPYVGRLRVASNGMAWKPREILSTQNIEEDLSRIFTVRVQEIVQCQWMRCSRGYRLKLKRRDDEVKFDGFSKEV